MRRFVTKECCEVKQIYVVKNRKLTKEKNVSHFFFVVRKKEKFKAKIKVENLKLLEKKEKKKKQSN